MSCIGLFCNKKQVSSVPEVSELPVGARRRVQKRGATDRFPHKSIKNMAANIDKVQEKLAGMLSRAFLCMQKVAPLFLDRFVVESIEDNLLFFRMLTNYFGPSGKRPVPYIHQHLTNIRQVRNQIVHCRVTGARVLVRLHESLLVFAEAVRYLENEDTKGALSAPIVQIAMEWKRILAAECGYCFPDVPDIIRMEKVTAHNISRRDVGKLATLQISHLPATRIEANIAQQSVASANDETLGEQYVEGTLAELKSKYMTVMKNKRVVILEGIHTGKSGKFVTWNGTNCYVELENTGRRAISLLKRAGLFLN